MVNKNKINQRKIVYNMNSTKLINDENNCKLKLKY